MGVLIPLVISGFVGLGSVIASLEDKLPNQKLSFGQCILTNGNESSTARFSPIQRINTDWKVEHANDSFFLKLFSMSYLYQTALSTLGTIVFGIICSLVILVSGRYRDKHTHSKVNVRLLSRPLLSLWVRIFGKERMSHWVDFEPATFGEAKPKNYLNNNSGVIELNT